MSCARHSPKLVLLVLNFLLFVSAVTFLVTGLWLLVITGLFETDIKRLLDTIEYDGVKIGTFLFSATLLFIIAGGVLLFVAVFGAVTAWKKVKGCLVVYVIVTIVVIVLQGVTVGLMIKTRIRSSDWLEGQLLKQLEGYQGPTATDQTSKSFNQLFMKTECCGVSAHGDPKSVSTSTTWYSAGAEVPATCCKGVTSSTAGNVWTSCTNTPKNYYTKPCFNRIDDIINTASLISNIVSGINFIMHVLAVILACLTLDRAKNRIQHVAPNTSRVNPPPYISIDAVVKNKFNVTKTKALGGKKF
ncbi:tetraspanin-11-like [Mya arenaria]|uniref:tetraspanin-11-like n=1 Tax=Mya arenaria TaxID=6604 RepID=UPI0022E43901|nr:tetraspanin-11-like [Mya arenaria]